MADKFYSKGKCGFPGGYCSDNESSDKNSCLCPSKNSKNVCIPTSNTWTVQNVNLVLMGEVFNPFGYGLAFRSVAHRKLFGGGPSCALYIRNSCTTTFVGTLL